MKLTQKFTVAASGIILCFTLIACNDSSNRAAEEQPAVVTEKTSDPLPAPGVNQPALVSPAADGALLLTAENGSAIGPAIKYMPEWRAFGWFTAADRVEWDVAVAAAGNYAATLEWSVSDEDAGKEFLLEAKGRQLTGIVAPSGSWETYKTVAIGNIQLDAGNQKIVFKANKQFDKGAILDLRQVTLRPVK